MILRDVNHVNCLVSATFISLTLLGPTLDIHSQYFHSLNKAPFIKPLIIIARKFLVHALTRYGAILEMFFGQEAN